MAFLAGGEAAIIDLRRNGGGSPDAVRRAISPFLEPGRPLMTFYMNGDVANERTATVEVPPESRMAGKPLYVLIGGATASAAEEFAGHVAGYRLGELVGETTAGAGFRNELVPVGGTYVLSVSVGRASANAPPTTGHGAGGWRRQSGGRPARFRRGGGSPPGGLAEGSAA